MESLEQRRLWKGNIFELYVVGLESKVMRECCFVVERDAWLRGFSFFLQMGFTLILATLDGLDVGLLGDVIGEDDYDDDGREYSYEVPASAASTATTDTASDGTGKKKGRTVIVTTEDMQKRKNDVKARTTLLLSLTDEHQLRFSKYKTTQELRAAILKTFGGNEATKKTKKNLLKQQYGNFKEECSKTLEQTFNRLQKKTEKKISVQGTDVAGFDKSKVECFNCHKMGHFARECSYMANDEENHALVADKEAPTEFALMANISVESKVFDNSLCSNDCKKNTDILNSKITDLTDKLFDTKIMIYHYKLGLAQVESRLVEHKDREIKYCEKIRGLEYEVEFKTNSLECLTKELETLKKEKEGLDGKLAGFQTASKDLDSLLESQRLDKNKEGLRYSFVPPPPAQIHSSTKKDMSWTGLPEFKDDTVTDYSSPAPTVESSPDDAQNRNPFVIKEALPSTISPKSFIKFVKANDCPTKSKIDKAEKAKKSHVKKFPTANKKFPTGGTKFSTADMGKKGKDAHDRQHILSSNFDPFDGGYVSFGQGGCKITGKGTIKTDSECIVLGRNFKLLDDTNVLLSTPRQHNMYSIDLNNIVPHKYLTCLVAKASADECIL
nr:ribonuclease H-like domain-containing protein [Tanacetum cinerariifolium]